MMLTSVVAFVVAFGLLVLVHEFGHFWVARRAGVFVEKFSIGFGPKIFGFKWGETDFQVSLFPLGGFVKMRGEGDEEEVAKDDARAFSNKSVGARSRIVLAGPMMNLILSFILMPLVFWIGKPEVTFLKEPPVVERILPGSPADKSVLQLGDLIVNMNEKPTPTWEAVLEPLALMPAGEKISLQVKRNGTLETIAMETARLPGGSEGAYLGFEKFFGKAPEAVVKEVIPQSPADQAGIKPGDRLTSVQKKPIQNWDDLIRNVNAQAGGALAVGVVRQATELSLSVQPQWEAQAGRWIMGIKGPDDINVGILKTHAYSFLEAVKVGSKTNVKNIGLTFEVLGKLVTRQLSYKTLGGPIQIAYTLAKASASGIADFIYFTAFLSLQLAILNILPIPMLDGGHILFFGIEAIRKRPLSVKIRTVAQQVGMVLLLTLIFFVTVNDLNRLLGLSQWVQKIFH